MGTRLDWLHGIFPALVTPFDSKTEEIDEEAYRRLIRHVLPYVDGVVTSGTTGEFPYLTRAEQRRLIEIAREEIGNKKVIAGCGASGTDYALALAQDAKEAGADAILVVTPYFLHPSDKEVYQHFHDIATRVDIPLILYNIPQVVDAVLPRNVVEDLADLPNVVGLKDSSGDLTYTLEILEYAGDRIDVLVGHDEVVIAALAAGVSGMILASAQVYPEIWREVYHLVREGRLEEARALQRQVQKLSRIFCRHGGGVAVKAALNMMGIPVGSPRRPLKSAGGALIHETRAEIQLELEKLGKIPVADEPFEYPGGPLEGRFRDLELTPEDIRRYGLRVGTGTAGEGVNRVQLDLVAGRKETPLGDAYALQLTYPLHGREALTTILEPGLTVRPATLLLPTLPQKNLRQANMIYGPTQAALARAIVDALEAGIIPASAADDEVMIVLATVHPKALDRHALYGSVYEAARAATAQAYAARH
ncbi:MAG: dihydrodipicolinate synthase family protein [Thermoflexales bacterium]|nr:dihydrodipicolinate synthase family protein [Thermoflexales bacterium]